MDVHCSSCGEPWDTYHLQHDEIYETDLAEAEIASWLQLPTQQKLQPRYRDKFAQLGWQFGHSLINVIRCPSCSKDARADTHSFPHHSTSHHSQSTEETSLTQSSQTCHCFQKEQMTSTEQIRSQQSTEQHGGKTYATATARIARAASCLVRAREDRRQNRPY